MTPRSTQRIGFRKDTRREAPGARCRWKKPRVFASCAAPGALRLLFGNKLGPRGGQDTPNSSMNGGRRLRLYFRFRYTPQSTKFQEVRRLSVLLKTSAATVVIGAALVSSLAAQEKKKPDWKDPAEYDLYKPITQTQDAKVWLDTLDKWTKQYPQSELAEVRRQLYLET